MGSRVAVYAISKNESRFVSRWMDSMSEADEVYVLDTGSSDGTPRRLRALGAHVEEARIDPFRFDMARNLALGMVPEAADICVCTDLDEVLSPGWREKLERSWTFGAGRASCRYVWSFNADGSEGCVFNISKIHRRRGYKWVSPVHETLEWELSVSEPPPLHIPGVQLEHHPDPAKSRSQYLPLLELAVSEDPENDRRMHYLGREYMYCGRWERCIETLTAHLAMKRSVWAEERSASMRYIAHSCAALGRDAEAERWHQRAIAEAPQLREPWLDYARFACGRGEWEPVVWLCSRALAIRERSGTYINEAESWGPLPHDLAALGYYYTGRYSLALEQIDKALSLSPGDERLAGNREYIINALSS